MSNYNEIAQRAYELWEKSGRPEGKDTEHWLQAETDLRRRESKRDVKSPGNQIAFPAAGSRRVAA